MREVVLDTETTGLDPDSGHRLVEIGCVELVNHVPTGEEFQSYLDPERDIPLEAFEVHGLSAEFLSAKPRFAEMAGDFLDFVADARLVIHNADFDLGFLNAELRRTARPPLPRDRVLDTLTLARRKFPGAPASLDALCRRFNVDMAARARHGALVDARLLAEVYLHLVGGRQTGLALAAGAAAKAGPPLRRAGRFGESKPPAVARQPRPHAASDDELAAHGAFVDALNDPVWHR